MDILAIANQKGGWAKPPPRLIWQVHWHIAAKVFTDWFDAQGNVTTASGWIKRELEAQLLMCY